MIIEFKCLYAETVLLSNNGKFGNDLLKNFVSLTFYSSSNLKMLDPGSCFTSYNRQTVIGTLDTFCWSII